MERKEHDGQDKKWRFGVGAVILVVLSAVGIYLFFYADLFKHESENNREAAADVPGRAETEIPTDGETGLILDAGWELVKVNCTGCHSAALVTQNRATREGWEGMIRWMQRTQKLWDLGENEKAILDYLAKNYAPEDKGRRENLKDIDWYELGESSGK